MWKSSFFNPFLTASSGMRKVLLLSFQHGKDVRRSAIRASTNSSGWQPPLRRLNHVAQGFPKSGVQNFWGCRASWLSACCTLGCLHEEKGFPLSPVWTCHVLMYACCFSLYQQAVNSLYPSTQHAGHRQENALKCPWILPFSSLRQPCPSGSPHCAGAPVPECPDGPLLVSQQPGKVYPELGTLNQRRQ